MALFGSSTMIVSSVFQDEKNVLNDLKLAWPLRDISTKTPWF
jgi:hypothetical protein